MTDEATDEQTKPELKKRKTPSDLLKAEIAMGRHHPSYYVPEEDKQQ